MSGTKPLVVVENLTKHFPVTPRHCLSAQGGGSPCSGWNFILHRKGRDSRSGG